ncbi:MAG: toll/interleukin-1 receptor domain-containing protein [Anaerolineae bacterium]|nr:toll/interleukin-1 receptor domain-containing protein [Anaerolineae bacterium]
MPRLFISYSRQDESFARRLATSLSEMGADIWIDIKDIPAGMKWSSAIQQGLDVCDAMIVVITPSSATSPNVEDEWQYYRDRGKAIVPVMVAPAQLHYQLGRLQYVNFYGQPYDIALTQLHAELWRNGISLRPPMNAVTTPVPRPQPQQVRAAEAARTTANTSRSVPLPSAQSPTRRKSRGILTLGCAALALVAVVGVAAFFALGGLDLFASSTRASATPTEAGPLATITPTTAATIETVASTVRVASASARLRTGPGVTYPAVDTFAVQGEIFSVVAKARSATDTETWFLIQHPTAGSVWISGVTVNLNAGNVPVPTALTVPPAPTATPTETATPTPSPTATSAIRTIFLPAEINFPYQLYTASFNTERFTIVNVRVEVENDFTDSIQLALRDEQGNVLNSNANQIAAVVEPNRTYEVEVSDPAGGTGRINVYIELREQ